MTLYEKCQQAGDTSIHDDYVYIGQTSSGEIEIPLKGEQIKAICTQGQNDWAVAEVCQSPHIKTWMKRYSDTQLCTSLSETGEWSEEELAANSREENIKRLVWLLAWDIFDGQNPNEHLAADELQEEYELARLSTAERKR